MWVPEWPWVAPLRQAGSTAAMTVSPSTNSPDSTLTRCTHSVWAIFCTSVTAAWAAPALMVPASAICPPASAYSGVRSSTSSTRSAVTASPWDTTGTRLPSTNTPRIRASLVSSSNPVNSVGPASISSR
ncbi:hypothetical protein C1Y40_02439 [Mycobacterium talmoniae]|uniref:Uncharacterized protein n=1 Tax=Mycobacterium talmoniae TaxID=1858794 RepID=A0A2S8BL05_9MYCO|nr:hypothetical protein C1Y40_02439 [Mycobacterium talmoniae]